MTIRRPPHAPDAVENASAPNIGPELVLTSNNPKEEVVSFLKGL